jgi:hypothetical protein
MRTEVKDWKRENAFRRLTLMGISIQDSSYLQAQYRNFQEEDEGILPPPLDKLFEDEKKEENKIFPEGPSCPVMVIMRRRKRNEGQ